MVGTKSHNGYCGHPEFLEEWRVSVLMLKTAKTLKLTSKSDSDVPASSWCAPAALLTLPLFPAHWSISALTTEPGFDCGVELQVIPPCVKSYRPAVWPSWPLSCSEAALVIFKMFSWCVSSDEDTIPCRFVCGSNELFDGIVFLPSACPSTMCMVGFRDCDWEAVETIFWVIPDCARMPPWVIIDTSVECIRMSQLLMRIFKT